MSLSTIQRFRRRHAMTHGLLLLAALVLAAAPAAQAQQCGDLILRVTQGDYEQSFFGFGPVILKPHQQGHIRAYWRSNSPDPYTLSVEYGHPSKFGYQGQNPTQVRQIIRMELQKPQNIERGRVVFNTVNAGQTTIGFRIQGSKNKSVFNKIPQQCRSGVLTIRVEGQQHGNHPGHGGNPGSSTVAGMYSSNLGNVVLFQDGARVWGTVAHQNRRLEGQINGNVVTGTWTQEPSFKPPGDAGSFQLTFSGVGFDGLWRNGYTGQWTSQWGGTRTQTRR